MYKEYIESLERVTITLSRGNKLIDELLFTIITQSPSELIEYLTNRKVWRKESNGKSLSQIGRVRTQYEGNQRQRRFRVYETPMVATLQNKKRFPFAVAGDGGYQMSEGQKGKGYYGIIKTYQAGFLEANNMEQYGMGGSPMRSDLYQSYGWLTAFSYKDNYPYPSRAAEYYLNLHGKNKLANKEADYWNIYRPVYSSRSNPHHEDTHPLFPADLPPDFEPDFPDAEEDSEDNPPWKETSQKNPYFMLKEPWGGTSVPIDERLAPLVQRLWNRGIKTWYSDQGGDRTYSDGPNKGKPSEGYLIIRWPYDEVKEKVSDIKRMQREESRGALGHMDSAEMYLRLGWYGFEPLEALYKAYNMKFPKSREEAALMLAEGAAISNPSDGVYSYEYEAIEAAQKLANETGRKQNVMAVLHMEEDGYSEVEYQITEETVWDGPSNWLVKTLEPKKTRDNPSEWRHGEFAEEDPFEEYF
jgi:hypothetical protein